MTTHADRVEWMALDRLRLDPQNPRLEDEDRGADQVRLAALLDELYDARDIAASIARRGYFPAEVVIGVPGSEDGTVTIVEGNRRLTAAKGLTDPHTRAAFSEPKSWERLAALASENGTVPLEIPVLVEADRDAIVANIGYRHISGIQPWEPYQQARYIAERIDVEGMTPREVAELVGITESQARSKYRDFAIARAAEKAGVSPTLIQESFGVWNAALGRVPIRQFIGAPDPGQVRPGEPVIAPDAEPRLQELVSWLFGPTRRIRESRDLGTLADVIAHPDGLGALRSGLSLAEALQATRQPRTTNERLVALLTTASSSLRNGAALVAAASEESREDLLADGSIQHLLGEIERYAAAFADD